MNCKIPYAIATNQSEFDKIQNYFVENYKNVNKLSYDFKDYSLDCGQVALVLSSGDNITYSVHINLCLNDEEYLNITNEILGDKIMKPTLQDLEAQVKELQSTIDKMKQEQCQKPTVKQWEPKGGTYYIKTDGEVKKGASVLDYKLFGTEYQTELQAIRARDAMRIHNRLLAYVAEFDVDCNGVQWKADWNDYYQLKYSVYYDKREKKYVFTWTKLNSYVGMVYMSKDCAIALVHKLNSGEVVL